MDNYYHLVIETHDGNLSQGMRQLNGIYTQNYLKRHEGMKDVPRSQRLIGRPVFKELWKDVKEKDKGMRNQKIREVVEMNGYSLKEVAEHVKLHYSTVSRIVSGKRAK